MWRATIKGLLAHKLRLGLTALAIVLGVAFVSGTFILTDTMGRTFDDLFATANKGVAVQVTGVPKFEATQFGETAGAAERVPANLLATIGGVDGVRVAEGAVEGYAQLVDTNGKAITTGGAPTFGVSWTLDPELNPLVIAEGGPPQAADQIVVDAGTADKHDLHVGDRVTVLLTGPSLQATIVGIAKFGSANNLGGATLVAFDLPTAQRVFDAEEEFDSIDVAAEPNVGPEGLKDRIQNVLPAGFQAKTGQETAEKQSQDLKQALSFFNIALLVFAVIALFVGSFLIFNTFQILITQRTRELALLRALGASPAQIRRSVISEAVVVGLFSSAVGLAAGFLLAIGLKGLLSLFGGDLPSTTLQLLPRTIIVAFVVGIGTTLLASVVPAIRASRIAPIAALRESQPAEFRFSTRRTITGSIITVAGTAMLLVALFGGGSSAPARVGLGAAAVFFGVAVLSPLIVRPVARFLGRPVRGVAGKLGKANSMRNPKRTASTAAALMIGLGLVAFVSVFAQSIKATTNKVLQETLKADYIVTSNQFNGFSQNVADRLRNDPAFGAVSEVRQGIFGLDGQAQTLNAVDPATLPAVLTVKMQAGSIADLGDGDVMVFKDTAESHGWGIGDSIQMEFARTGERDMKIAAVYADNFLLGNFVISLATFDQNFVEQLDFMVMAKRAAGVSPSQAGSSATAVAKSYPNVQLDDQTKFRQRWSDQINSLLVMITALLGLAIIIAVFGIVNTLALSIYERTREIGLLRAVGMLRVQVKRMIRWESVIIAVFGALLGTAVGIFFGWALVQALKSQGITELAIPGIQLVIYILVAALFGVLAAILPARRAAKLDILRAIAYE